MKQKYTWRPWNVFFSKLKRLPKWSGWYSYLSYSSNIFRFKRNSYSLYLYIYRHRFGMFWIYTTFVWKTVFGLENRCWSPISVCNDPASDGSRNPSKARRWRWGNIYIYFCILFLRTYSVFVLTGLFSVLCILHSALNCAARACNAHWGQRFEQPSVQAGLQARAVKTVGAGRKSRGVGALGTCSQQGAALRCFSPHKLAVVLAGLPLNWSREPEVMFMAKRLAQVLSFRCYKVLTKNPKGM